MQQCLGFMIDGTYGHVVEAMGHRHEDISGACFV